MFALFAIGSRSAVSGCTFQLQTAVFSTSDYDFQSEGFAGRTARRFDYYFIRRGGYYSHVQRVNDKLALICCLCCY